jgi:hypothetical protein
MDLIKTADSRFMRKGDQGIFVNHVPMTKEYHITVEKEYSCAITEAVAGYQITCNLCNDLGSHAVHSKSFDMFSGGYTTVYALVPRDEYIRRANTIHAHDVLTLTDKFTLDMETLNTRQAKRLEVANVTASV